MSFSADSRLVAAAEGGLVVDLATGKQVVKCRWPANTTNVAFSPDGRMLAGINTAGVVVICDAATGEQVRKLKPKLKEDGDVVAFSPDGSLLYAGDTRGQTRAWNARTGEPVGKFDLPDCMIVALAFADAGRQVLVAAHRCDYTGKPELFIVTLDPKLAKEHKRVSVLAEPDFDHIRFRDTETAVAFGNKHLAVVSLAGDKTKVVARAEFNGIDDAQLSPDGRLLALSCDMEPARSALTLKELLANSPDGKYRPPPQAFLLLDAATLKPLCQLDREYPNHVAFSPDGRLLALSTWGKGEVWEVQALLA